MASMHNFSNSYCITSSYLEEVEKIVEETVKKVLIEHYRSEDITVGYAYRYPQQIEEKVIYWDYNSNAFFMGTQSDWSVTLLTLINKISNFVLEQTMNCGVDTINIYSPCVLSIFDLFNLRFTNIFKSKLSYINNDDYVIGTLNFDRYNVFLRKLQKRELLIEKRGNYHKGEIWDTRKENIIELYSKEHPQYLYKIIINNLPRINKTT